MNFKRLTWVVGLLACTSVMAEEQVQHSVMVTADIPTERFYVQPVGEWINAPQRLEYNVFTQQLTPLAKQFDIKSTIGPVEAFLTSGASLQNGAAEIGLTVSVAGQALTTVPQQILNTADAAAGKVVALNITPAAAPQAGYTAGSYSGVVNMMFESSPPPPTPPTPPAG